MPDNVRDILNDLYAVEPALAQRESELIPIIQKLLDTKPDATVDPAFREKLRNQLLQKISQPSSLPFMHMRKLSYALFAVIMLAVAGFGTYTILQKPPTSSPQEKISRGVSVTNRENAAFGSLGVNASSPKQSGFGLGGGTPNATAQDSAARSSLIAPVPERTVRYTYTGDTLTLPSLPVLKRVKGFTGTNVQGIMQSLQAPLANVGSFTNVGVQQVTFAENRENGYVIALDALAGTASVYQNWERWTTLQKMITEPAPAGTAVSIPADNVLTDIASAFLQAHSIHLEGYGAPIVRKDWVVPGSTTPAYTPTDVPVVYPLTMDGNSVVDAAGQVYGITVNVNLATKLVTSVYNITGLQFEASSYPMVTKAETVLEVVQRGGVYGSGSTKDTTALNVEVGTPKAGYMFSSYQLDGGSSDVLVPALIFPITKIPNGAQVYTQNIVVPLVQELIEPQIIQPLTSGGSAGSAAGVQVDTPQATVKE